MGEVLLALGELISYVLNALGIIQAIQGQQQKQAQEDTLLVTETGVIVTQNAVTSPVSGNQALYSLLGAIQTGTTPSLATITALIDALTPTTLPSTQPPGWPAESAESLLGAPVPEPWWGEGINESQLQGELFNISSNLLGLTGATGWPDRCGPWFALTEYWTPLQWGMVHPIEPAAPYLPPTDVDWTTWDGVQTLIEFLMASWPEYAWDHNGPAGYPTPGIVWGHIAAEVPARWRCLVEEWQLPFVSGRAYTALTKFRASLAPIWPGLDGVTLGTPTVLTDSGIVLGLMHGAMVTIDSIKPGAGHLGVDGYEHVYHAGFLAFLTDTGAAEERQYLGWNTAYYLPKQMTRASGVLLVLANALQVTVTPFTIV